MSFPHKLEQTRFYSQINGRCRTQLSLQGHTVKRPAANPCSFIQKSTSVGLLLGVTPLLNEGTVTGMPWVFMELTTEHMESDDKATCICQERNKQGQGPKGGVMGFLSAGPEGGETRSWRRSLDQIEKAQPIRQSTEPKGIASPGRGADSYEPRRGREGGVGTRKSVLSTWDLALCP